MFYIIFFNTTLFYRIPTQNTKRQQSTQEDTNGGDVHLSALAQQIAWEESHLGDFRRIMPPPQSGSSCNDPSHYYCQFFDLQNQSSIYAETVASKRREEVAKKLRVEIEEKNKKNLQIKSKKKLMVSDLWLKRRRRFGLGFTEKYRKLKSEVQEKWSPQFISYADEKSRLTMLDERTSLIRKSKIFLFVILCLLVSTSN